MKKMPFYLLPLCGVFSSCASLLPVNNHYEKAGNIGRGNIEAVGSATQYRVHHFDRDEHSNRNFGFRAGYGISEKFDLKFRYERLVFSKNFDGQLKEADYFAVVPKFIAVRETVALLCPIGVYHTNSEAYGNKYDAKIASIAPQIIITLPVIKSKADVSFSIKTDYFYEVDEDSYANLMFGITAGAGFSSDLRRWAIRPEMGLAYNSNNEYFWSYGIGFQFVLPTDKRAR